jgi:hypothetical protein
MDSTTVEILVVASDASGKRAHLYPSIKRVFDDRAVGTGTVGESLIECFDNRGYRLGPVYDHTWQLVGLRETTDPPDPSIAQQRLGDMLRDTEAFVRSHPDVLAKHGLELDEVLARLPAPGWVDLADDFDACRPLFGHPLIGDDRDFLHNFFVHGMT